MDESLRYSTIALMASSEALVKHAQMSQLSVLYDFFFQIYCPLCSFLINPDGCGFSIIIIERIILHIYGHFIIIFSERF